MSNKKKYAFLAALLLISLSFANAQTNAEVSVSNTAFDLNQRLVMPLENSPVEMPVINSVPAIDSFSPEARTIAISTRQKQNFGVTVSDADNDGLMVKWYFDGKEVATGSNYLFGAEKRGTFEVKVEVSDGKASTARKWVLNVEEKKPLVSDAIKIKQKIGKELESEIAAKPDKNIRVLVKMADEESLNRFAASIESEGGKTEGKFMYGGLIVADIPAKKIGKIALDNAVEGIYLPKVVYPSLDTSVSQIAAPEVWAKGYRGGSARIAVIDTGIDSSHPMLQGKIVLARDFTDNNNVSDLTGHGTHVAGIAAGTNANGGNYDGVAPSAQIMNAKVFQLIGGNPGAYTTDIIEAINWAIDPDQNPATDDGADVINMSLGGTGTDPAMDATVKAAVNAGVTVVVSAGNCGNGCPSSDCGSFRGVTFPGNIAESLTVGAVDDSNAVACFSSGENVSGVGIKPDVSAPGVSIISPYPNNRYAFMSGTSMSAPHVAGAAALLRDANPSITPVQVKKLLELNAIDLGAAGKDTSYGSGMIYLADIIEPKAILSDSSIIASVELGQVYRKTIKISNYGTKDLEIYSVNSESWIETSLEKQIIKSTETSDMNITINSSSLGVGNYNGSINLISNSTINPIPVTLQVNPTNKPTINSINIERNVFRGQVQDIVVDASDDTSVSSVSVWLIYPDGTENNLQLVLSADGLWRYLRFQMPTAQSAMWGPSTLIVTAIDNENNTSVYETTFDLVNFIQSLPQEFVVNNEAAIGLAYKNTSDTLKQAKATFEVFDKTGIKISEGAVSEDVYSNQIVDLNWAWLPNEIGNYSIRTTFFEDGLRIEQRDQNIVVLIPEAISSIAFSMSPMQVVKGDLINYNLIVNSNGAATVDAFVEINILQKNNVYDVAVSEIKTAAAGGSETFVIGRQFLLPAGEYTAVAKLHYGNREKTAAIDFNSTTPSNGIISSVTLPAQIYIDQNYLLGVEFTNTGNVPLDVLIEGFVYKDSEQVDTVEFGAARVEALSSMLFETDYKFEDLAGDYNLQVIALYEGNTVDNNSGFYVTDRWMPFIGPVSYPVSIGQNSPFVVQVKAKEHSKIGNAFLSVDGANIAMRELWRIDANVTLNATFTGTETAKTYNFAFSICDEFNNCASSGNYSFNVLPCIGNPVLIVSDENYFAGQLESSYCVSQWGRSESLVPELPYLQRFDAVIWSAGNDTKNVDENDAIVLMDYVKNGGRLLLEGGEIAYKHRDDNFMREVAHSVYAEDFLFTTADANGGGATYDNSISVSAKHPVVSGLSSFDINAETGPYPDAVLPANGGVSLADWNSGKSAMVIFNDFNAANARVLFLPFTFNALEQSVQNQLLNNSMNWLLTDSNIDLGVDDIILPSYAIEGNSQIDFSLTNDQSTQLEVYVDGGLRQTLNVSGNTATANLALSAGEHTIEAFINPSFSIREKNYLNNSLKKTFRVATSEADLAVIGLTITPSNPKSGEIVDFNAIIENIGGSAANATVQFFIDENLLNEKAISLNYNENIVVPFDWNSYLGIHNISIVVSAPVDSNALNNELNEKIYACNKGLVLVVGDDDSESYTSDNPSGVQDIEQTLQNLGYCAEAWMESEKGIPSVDYLNGFDAIIWSSGNYWNTAIDENDVALLGQFTGNILFEGADIAFDHDADALMQNSLHSIFNKDLLLDGNTSGLILQPHEILAGISGIDLNASLCPYPDSVSPSGSQGIAGWNDGSGSAITVFDGNTNKSVYFAFCIAAVSDKNIQKKLIANSVEWLTKEEQSIPIACYNDSNCNDSNSSTDDLCINPGIPASYCENREIKVGIVKVSKDTLDGFIFYKNAVYSGVSSTAINTGHYSDNTNYFWRRPVLDFNLVGMGQISKATLFLDYQSKTISNETCSFDLYSVPSLGASIDKTDWSTTAFEKTIDNWFGNTLASDLTGNVASAWNSAVNAGRQYISFRIEMDNESSYISKTGKCLVYFYDTAAGAIDPYIIYSTSPQNSAPLILSSSPSSNPSIKELETQNFSITKADPDNDASSTKWYLDNVLVLSNADSYTYTSNFNADSYTYTSNFNSAGDHNITAIVSDGQLSTQREWRISVADIPAVLAKSDSLDGYVQYRNGSYYSVSSSAFYVGHFIGSPYYYWRRGVIEFDLTGKGRVQNATLFLDYTGKTVGGETCTFDLYNIPSLGSSIDKTDWNTNEFAKVKDNWFSNTISKDLNLDITDTWNSAIDNQRNNLTIRIAMDNESTYISVTNKCGVYFADSSPTGSYPHIKYVS